MRSKQSGNCCILSRRVSIGIVKEEATGNRKRSARQTDNGVATSALTLSLSNVCGCVKLVLVVLLDAQKLSRFAISLTAKAGATAASPASLHTLLESASEHVGSRYRLQESKCS